MLETAVQVLPTYLSPAFILLAALYAWRKTSSETESTLVSASNSLLDAQHQEVAYWRAEVIELRKRVEELEAELKLLKK